MTAATRERIRSAKDREARSREQGNPSTDPTLNRVVWMPSARASVTPSIFRAYHEYEGRLAA